MRNRGLGLQGLVYKASFEVADVDVNRVSIVHRLAPRAGTLYPLAPFSGTRLRIDSPSSACSPGTICREACLARFARVITRLRPLIHTNQSRGS